MNRTEQEMSSKDHATPKAIYERPMLTTFGTVAKLTMTGGTEALPDSKVATRKRG